MRHIRLASTSCNMLEEYYDHRAVVHYNPTTFSVTWDGGYGIEGNSGIFGFDLSSIPATAKFPVKPTLSISVPSSQQDAKMMVWGILRHCVLPSISYHTWGAPGQGEDRSWQSGGARGLLDRGSTYLGYWDPPTGYVYNEWYPAELNVTQKSELPPYGFFQIASGYLYDDWYGVPPGRTFVGSAYLDVWYTDDSLATCQGKVLVPEPMLTEGVVDLQRGGTTGRMFMQVPFVQLHSFAARESQSTPVLTYEVRNATTRALAADDVANHDVRVISGLRSSRPYRRPRAVANCVGVFAVPLTKIELDSRCVTLAGSTSSEGLELQPSHNIALTASIAEGTIVKADLYKLDGSRDAVLDMKQDILEGYERGEVVVGEYGYGCAATTQVFCTTLPVREDSSEIASTGIYEHGYARHLIRLEGDARWKAILKSTTIGELTEITLALPLPAAPADGTKVTVGGCTEPETAEG